VLNFYCKLITVRKSFFIMPADVRVCVSVCTKVTIEFRVTIFQKNLEMSGNLTDIREKLGN